MRLGSGLLACALMLQARPADACSRAPAATFEIDPELRETDRTAPAAFRELTAFTRRIAATRCKNGVCTASSCGDSGVLELSFEAPQAADSSSEPLGYRVVWLSGHVPAGLESTLARTYPLSDAHSVSIELSWESVEQLNGELALVAVDRAGNESAVSAPAHVEWSGCTSHWDDRSCNADRAHIGCSLAGEPSGRGGLPLMAALAVLAGVFGLRRRARANSTRALL